MRSWPGVAVLILLGVGACVAPAAAQAPPPVTIPVEKIVDASRLLCRAAPERDARVVATLPRGHAVRVQEYRGDWERVWSVLAPNCWVAHAFLAMPGTRAFAASQTSRTPVTPRRDSVPRRAGLAEPPFAPSRRVFSGGGCPCSSGRICVGPRGGRYCITAGGHRRYGFR